MLSQIRHMMENNKFLKRYVPAIRLTRIMQYRRHFKLLIQKRGVYLRRVLKRANETSEQFRTCYEAHKSDFDKVAGMLEDDFSRKTLQTVIRYRLSPSAKTLLPVVNGAQYFPRSILRKEENEVFIDGGGFTGDTIIALASFWGKNYWKKVYTWEPNDISRGSLIKNIDEFGFKNVEVIPMGLWSEKTELSFSAHGDSSRISKNGLI